MPDRAEDTTGTATVERVRGLGTLVNVAVIVAGTVVGIGLRGRLPARVRTTLLQGLALAVLAAGMDSALETRNFMFPITAIVAGGAIGEALRIEDRLEGAGEWLRRRFGRADQSTFVEGFVDATLVFCVGPLAILGAIADGLRADPQLLLVKSALDGLASVVFASTLGWGVAASAIPVALYQGTMTAAAGVLDSVLTDRMVTEMTATGGLMILGIGIRLFRIAEVRVASFLPGLVIAPVAVALFAH